jgi:hypothetical protein
MRRIALILALAASSTDIIGCHSNTPSTPSATPSTLPTGRSLADMEAEYSKMRKQYLADCVQGTPEHVRDNQPLCETERQKMTPLGNTLIMAEQEAAKRQTNP